MPELIERGYVYIAQPPLYKMARKKQQTYLKDDSEMAGFLLDIVVENVKIKAANGETIGGKALKSLIRDNHAVTAIVERLSRNYDGRVLHGFMQIEPVIAEDLLSPESARRIGQELENELNRNTDDIVRYAVEHQSGANALAVKKTQYGLEEETLYTKEFFLSNEYRTLLAHATRLRALEQEGSTIEVTWGENTQEFATFGESVEWILSRAKKGFTIQRYKGLGEMNPEQLWDTTMDPTIRRLLQVTIEDNFGADETFTTLMGDQVEPRREFIVKNAFAVSNLDI
jgi:DNA gyrase subunit B